jgi:hypothetical protein
MILLLLLIISSDKDTIGQEGKNRFDPTIA